MQVLAPSYAAEMIDLHFYLHLLVFLIFLNEALNNVNFHQTMRDIGAAGVLFPQLRKERSGRNKGRHWNKRQCYMFSNIILNFLNLE